MKISRIFGVLVFAICTNAWAVPTTELRYGGGDVFVGDSFELELWVDGNEVNEALLSFGFNVGTGLNDLLSYDGFAIGADFMDVSDPFDTSNVAGVNANLIPDVVDDMLLATLSFTALDSGEASVSAQGIYDGLFSGLYYESPLNSFDVDSNFSITISDAAQVSEPATLGLLLFGVFATSLCRRRSNQLCV